MLRSLALVVVGVACAAQAVALDFVIDSFTEATNTVVVQVSFIDPPAVNVDTGLAGVRGGSREIEVVSSTPVLVQSGVIVADGIFDFMTDGNGSATATYDGSGAGLGSLLACVEAIEIDYERADVPAVAGAMVQIVMVDGSSNTSPVLSSGLSGSEGTLSFPIEQFTGVDLGDIAEISVTMDAESLEAMSSDLAISEIRAVNCDFETPAPSMGPVALGMATIMLTGLGYLGFRRRGL